MLNSNILSQTTLNSSMNSLACLDGAYVINIPIQVNLNESGSFNIELKENNLLDNETLSLDFDQQVLLVDCHGGNDLKVNVLNPNLEYTKNDETIKTLNYEIDNPKAGEFTGTLNLKISINEEILTNTLQDGKTINTLLKSLNPSKITFKHNYQKGTYLYDISLLQDQSILLYQNNDEIIISNYTNEAIMANKDSSYLFKSLRKLEEINNLDYLNLENCRNTSRMFSGCFKLKSIDVSSFNTTKVSDMSYMFESLNACTSIGDISNWDVRNVKSFKKFLFNDMKLGNYGDLSKWQVSNKCEDLSYMFYCNSYENLKENSSFFISDLDLSNWDVSSLKDCSYMFYNCFNLTQLNLTGWCLDNLVNMAHCFECNDELNSSKLTNIIGLSKLNIEKLTNMERAFYHAVNLSKENDFSELKPLSLTNMKSAFDSCNKLDLSDFENWSTYFLENIDYSNCFDNIDSTKPSWY